MARTPDSRVAAKREEAARLEREGKSTAEIAETMGARAGTVKRWLQIARGPKETTPYQSRIIEMLKEGETFEAIVSEVGCAPETVRKAERAIRSSLSVSYSWRGKRVERFAADPKNEKQKRYAQSESFWRDLVAQCNDAVNTDPKDSKDLLAIGVQHFSALRRRLLSPEKKRLAECNLVQVKAAQAARERALERPEDGLSILQQLSENCSCDSCRADLARREAIILRDLREWDGSIDRIEFAESLYREMGHSGHDVNRNGLGNCVLVRITILNYMGRYVESLKVASLAERDLIKPSEGALYFRLRYNSALSLVEIPGRAGEAKQIGLDLLKECGDAPSKPRLYVIHLLGSAEENLGRPGAAVAYYKDASEDADALEIPAAIGALEADIGRLTGPIEFQERVGRILEWSRDTQSWVHPLYGVLSKALKISERDLRRAISVLRRESGGDRILPRFSGYPLLSSAQPIPP